jgi:GntR family transcriptional regulator / MocR family aminotransferase
MEEPSGATGDEIEGAMPRARSSVHPGVRTPRSAPPPLLTLDRTSSVPIFRQIYQGLREAILSRRLIRGSKLPPSRSLADELAVARSTIVLAYEHLEAEGYLVGRGAAGTFVAALPLSIPRHPTPPARHSRTGPGSRRARDEAEFGPLGPAPVPFRIGEPALDAFPLSLWLRLQARCARRSGGALLGYGDPAGYLPLRQVISEYVRVSRGVVATADQVILVRGTQQAIDLVSRVLLRGGGTAWVEDPGYLATRSVVEMAGAAPVPVPVDADGLVVEAGMRRAPSARMAYVSPSHHFPLGGMLSLPRRLALLDWAHRAGAWIVEDDYDSEFRFTGLPIASLQGLDTAGRVIYVGTFSKTVYPALRIGYLIPPPELVELLLDAKSAVLRPRELEAGVQGLAAVLRDFRRPRPHGASVR